MVKRSLFVRSAINQLPINHALNVTIGRDVMTTQLSDIFIGIKTTKRYHKSRMRVLLETWLDRPDVMQQTYIFTDGDDSEVFKETNGHLINTHCKAQYSSDGLCCKMGVNFSKYLKTKKRWWCTVDDDNYLNADNLVTLLKSYSHNKYHYIGRASVTEKTVIHDKGDGKKMKPGKASFWFGTGGAGVCVSRALAMKMIPYATTENFPRICNRVSGRPDDVSLGFLIDFVLGVNLTNIEDLHSHLHPLSSLKEKQITKAVTLSYLGGKTRITISLNNTAFKNTEDPTRLKSLHCKLHQKANICPKA